MAAFVKILAVTAAPWKTARLPQVPASDLVLDFYDRERAALERYLSLLGVQPQNASDIVHDTFVKLHEHLASGGERTNVRAWLYRVAHNMAHNRRRAAVSRVQNIAELTAEPAAHEPTPEQLLLSRERERRMQAAVGELAPAERNCLLLRAQGFRYREIAGILQMSTSGVGDLVQRAIERVRRLL